MLNYLKKEKYLESKTFIKGNKLKIAKLPWGNLDLQSVMTFVFQNCIENSQEKIKFITIPSAFTKVTGKKHWVTLLKSRAMKIFVMFYLINMVKIIKKEIHLVIQP